ncbi:MAG: lactate utilization protein C [Alphaproteobacteria bacterium]|nr:lactate utilization protein C [Alphaproteobacteria bacterium]
MADSREQILGRLRRFARPEVDLAPAPPPPAQAGAILDLFVERLGAARATVDRAAGLAEVPAAAARYLAGQNLPARLRLAPGLAGRLDFAATPLTLEDGLPEADGIAVLTDCLAGVAETGTFVAASGPGSDPRLNLLAETLIVVVATGRVAASYEDVWRMLDGTPRLVGFVTGASRTADIEQTIEWGAHGPRRLHVILCDETP